MNEDESDDYEDLLQIILDIKKNTERTEEPEKMSNERFIQHLKSLDQSQFAKKKESIFLMIINKTSTQQLDFLTSIDLFTNRTTNKQLTNETSREVYHAIKSKFKFHSIESLICLGYLSQEVYLENEQEIISTISNEICNSSELEINYYKIYSLSKILQTKFLNQLDIIFEKLNNKTYLIYLKYLDEKLFTKYKINSLERMPDMNQKDRFEALYLLYKSSQQDAEKEFLLEKYFSFITEQLDSTNFCRIARFFTEKIFLQHEKKIVLKLIDTKHRSFYDVLSKLPSEVVNRHSKKLLKSFFASSKECQDISIWTIFSCVKHFSKKSLQNFIEQHQDMITMEIADVIIASLEKETISGLSSDSRMKLNKRIINFSDPEFFIYASKLIDYNILSKEEKEKLKIKLVEENLLTYVSSNLNADFIEEYQEEFFEKALLNCSNTDGILKDILDGNIHIDYTKIKRATDKAFEFSAKYKHEKEFFQIIYEIVILKSPAEDNEKKEFIEYLVEQYKLITHISDVDLLTLVKVANSEKILHNALSKPNFQHLVRRSFFLDEESYITRFYEKEGIKKDAITIKKFLKEEIEILQKQEQPEDIYQKVCSYLENFLNQIEKKSIDMTEIELIEYTLSFPFIRKIAEKKLEEEPLNIDDILKNYYKSKCLMVDGKSIEKFTFKQDAQKEFKVKEKDIIFETKAEFIEKYKEKLEERIASFIIPEEIKDIFISKSRETVVSFREARERVEIALNKKQALIENLQKDKNQRYSEEIERYIKELNAIKYVSFFVEANYKEDFFIRNMQNKKLGPETLVNYIIDYKGKSFFDSPIWTKYKYNESQLDNILEMTMTPNDACPNFTEEDQNIIIKYNKLKSLDTFVILTNKLSIFDSLLQQDIEKQFEEFNLNKKDEIFIREYYSLVLIDMKVESKESCLIDPKYFPILFQLYKKQIIPEETLNYFIESNFDTPQNRTLKKGKHINTLDDLEEIFLIRKMKKNSAIGSMMYALGKIESTEKQSAFKQLQLYQNTSSFIKQKEDIEKMK